MIQNVLQHLGGIENYGILSICLFFACFLGIVAWAVCLRRPYLDHMARLPLEGDAETMNSSKGVISHE
jgi:hypothetical protein